MTIAYRIIKCAMKGTKKDNIEFHKVGYLQKKKQTKKKVF